MQCHHYIFPRFSLSLHRHHHHLFSLHSIRKSNPNSRILLKMSLSSSSSSISEEELKQQQKSHHLQTLQYHQQTKHHFTKFAKGPGRLDWANQPNPFRRYIDAPLISLQHFPIEEDEQQFSGGVPLYSSVFLSLPPPKPISFSSISQLLYDSLALSAWKTTGFSTWSLRVNPSSGNLHPTEAYIVAPAIGGLSNSGFVAHYAPKEHGLEIRAEIPAGFFDRGFPDDCFFVGFSSIFWREAWKYGERAFRYCNHDVGHAIAAVAIAAAELGWDVKLLDGLGFDDLEKLFGFESFPKLPIPSRPVKGKFSGIEFEHPDCVLAVFPRGGEEGFDVNFKDLSSRISEFSKLDWKGEPNVLSKEHVVWDIIYRTSEAVKKPLSVGESVIIDPFQCSGVCSDSSYKGLTVREVVRKRRSAVDMDGITVIHRDTFYQILLHCLPSGSRSGEKQGKQLALPFRALSWDSEVHAALFVHRVSGLPKGLYFLVRNENHLDDLRNAMRPEFTWRKPEGCPVDLPLYELAPGDCKELSKRLSCHQDIAGDGCFSLGMISHFEPTLQAKGAWMYPRLFWETGVLGQVLYLEAHAVGISATGIGCFFDDPVHEVLGLKGSDYQSLYHFTVGGPVIDKRIMSLPAYPGPEIDA
ncbi:uncharacterized protein LOC110714558 [Chenopodium quinoa]|uniref:Nitroreductase domain-containing protein n=1 Tax=Chenopodium quinoa TaxID=63459 RepID=A0A803KYT0_CHEQI|nr:uncharacterized protein LOC110714558 [Chenopodium quinoa]